MGADLCVPLISQARFHAHCRRTRLEVGACEINGSREANEDRLTIRMNLVHPRYPHGFAMMGVFDGHCGDACSQYLSQHLPDAIRALSDPMNPDQLRQCWLDMDAKFLRESGGSDAGSTAIVALVETIPPLAEAKARSHRKLAFDTPKAPVPAPAYRIRIIHLGDSRAVLASMQGETPTILYETKDHKPMDDVETARIKAAGGYVAQGRIDGNLAVSRAFGDRPFKRAEKLRSIAQRVSPEPVTHLITLSTEEARHSILLLYCDGLSEAQSNIQIVNQVKKHLPSCSTALVTSTLCLYATDPSGQIQKAQSKPFDGSGWSGGSGGSGGSGEMETKAQTSSTSGKTISTMHPPVSSSSSSPAPVSPLQKPSFDNISVIMVRFGVSEADAPHPDELSVEAIKGAGVEHCLQGCGCKPETVEEKKKREAPTPLDSDVQMADVPLRRRSLSPAPTQRTARCFHRMEYRIADFAPEGLDHLQGAAVHYRESYGADARRYGWPQAAIEAQVELARSRALVKRLQGEVNDLQQKWWEEQARRKLQKKQYEARLQPTAAAPKRKSEASSEEKKTPGTLKPSKSPIAAKKAGVDSEADTESEENRVVSSSDSDKDTPPERDGHPAKKQRVSGGKSIVSKEEAQ